MENWFISKNIFRLFIFVLLGKLILSAILPMGADEAYYWVWSKNLRLSYFDHPGMISWLLGLGDALFKFGSACRWPLVLLGHASVFVWIQIMRRQLDASRLFWFTVLFYCSPLVGFGSIVATPDVPLVFFWSLCLLIFIHFVDRPSSHLAFFLGACLGLGFCSKYHIVLFLPAALFYLTANRLWSRIQLSHVAVVILAGLIFCSPVLVWNFQNDFSSFIFQINHGLGRTDWDPFWSYSYPLGQVALLFPTVLYFAIQSLRKRKSDLLVYFGFFPLLFFFVSSFRGVVEMNWPIMSYPAIIGLACFVIPKKSYVYAPAIFLALVFSVMTSHLLHPWIPNPNEKLNEPFVYEDALRAKGRYEPLFAENYQMASFMWFKSKQPTYKLLQMSRRDFYDELPASKPDTSPFFVVMRKTAALPMWVTTEGYDYEIVEDLNENLVVTKVFKK